jgi:hypothetical protein
MTINYSDNQTFVSEGLPGQSDSFNRSLQMTMSYNPLRMLYLFSEIQFTFDNDGSRTFQNYGVTWSPFPDGALQFRFYYNDQAYSDNGQRIKTIVPSLRYNLSKTSYLDISYQVTKDESKVQDIDSNFLSFRLRIGF